MHVPRNIVFHVCHAMPNRWQESQLYANTLCPWNIFRISVFNNGYLYFRCHNSHISPLVFHEMNAKSPTCCKIEFIGTLEVWQRCGSCQAEIVNEISGLMIGIICHDIVNSAGYEFEACWVIYEAVSSIILCIWISIMERRWAGRLGAAPLTLP